MLVTGFWPSSKLWLLTLLGVSLSYIINGDRHVFLWCFVLHIQACYSSQATCLDVLAENVWTHYGCLNGDGEWLWDYASSYVLTKALWKFFLLGLALQSKRKILHHIVAVDQRFGFSLSRGTRRVGLWQIPQCLYMFAITQFLTVGAHCLAVDCQEETSGQSNTSSKHILYKISGAALTLTATPCWF